MTPNFEILVPFIKQALYNQGLLPQALLEDSNETDEHNIDHSLVDNTTETPEEAQNVEGKIIETAFRELEEEKNLEKAEDADKMKVGQSLWQTLAQTYGNHGRKNSA